MSSSKPSQPSLGTPNKAETRKTSSTTPAKRAQIDTSLENVSNVRNVSSKVGSLDNVHHTPKGGEKKIFSEKVDFSKAKSKIGSLENIHHKPAGGDKPIVSEKLDFKVKAQPKVGSKENLSHTPKVGVSKLVGGDKKIFNQKLDIKAKAKVGSLDNINHVAGRSLSSTNSTPNRSRTASAISQKP